MDGSISSQRTRNPVQSKLPPVPAEHTVDVRVAFVGRQEELRQLVGAVEGGKRLRSSGPAASVSRASRWRRSNAGNGTRDRAPPLWRSRKCRPKASPTRSRALDVAEEPNRNVIDTVADALAGAPRTIVLDNCEHAAAEVASAVERLQKIPGVALVATSRSRLGLSDEVVLPVTPFDARDGSAFFNARARCGTVPVDVDGADAPAVDRIVANLDGLAIAIDLAAAASRRSTYPNSPKNSPDLRPYHFRSSGSREQRHWSLNHVVDWSVERLSEDGRRAFALAGRFAGHSTQKTSRRCTATTARVSRIRKPFWRASSTNR